MSWSLAIDLGTSFTSAAVRIEDKVLDVEFDGKSTVPSGAAVEHTGKILVGYEAATFAEQFPERTERLPKRALARRQPLRIGGTTIEPSDLVATLFAYVTAKARSQHGYAAGDLERVVLTHPVRWSAAARTALCAAADRAGLPHVELMAESIAAGRGFLADRRVEPGARVAVYDLGGGTFDTAVLRRTESGFTTDGSLGGNEELGGEDFDDRLRELIAERAIAVEPELWHAIWEATSGLAARTQVLLRRDLVAAKEHLSIANSTGVYVRGFADEWIVSRAQLEAVIRDLVQRTVRLLRNTIKRSEVPVEELAAIYLTGGASRTPLVRTLLEQAFPVRLQAADLPKLAVARGALADLPPVAKPKTLVRRTPPVTPTTVTPTPTYQPPSTRPSPPATQSSRPSGGGEWVGYLLAIAGVIVALLVGVGVLGVILDFLGELF
jgi:molecular chaperone DnaK (HSP70)